MDQACLGAVVAVSLCAIAVYWVAKGGPRGNLIEIERAAPLQVDFQLDVNEADWPELTLLPGVGETLARRIVESRRKDGPFMDHEDLRRVEDIGPKTLAKLRPFLKPIADVDSLAAEGATR